MLPRDLGRKWLFCCIDWWKKDGFHSVKTSPSLPAWIRGIGRVLCLGGQYVSRSLTA
jgi:hypothetical protein